MKTSLDCIPCFVRQALDAARLVSTDATVHERILREVLHWAGEMDMNQPPPVMAQRIHRRLREIVGREDPYRDAKEQQNRMAMSLLPELAYRYGSRPRRRILFDQGKEGVRIQRLAAVAWQGRLGSATRY